MEPYLLIVVLLALAYLSHRVTKLEIRIAEATGLLMGIQPKRERGKPPVVRVAPLPETPLPAPTVHETTFIDDGTDDVDTIVIPRKQFSASDTPTLLSVGVERKSDGQGP